MASKQQIDQNVSDVVDAWGWVQYVINTRMPASLSQLERIARLAGIRKNYR